METIITMSFTVIAWALVYAYLATEEKNKKELQELNNFN